MDKTKSNLDFFDDSKVSSCFPTILHQYLSMEIISPSKIYYCYSCELNFRSQKKLEKHSKKYLHESTMNFKTKKEISD